MKEKDMSILLEQYYRFVGIPNSKKRKIFNILSYCKEIRDTAYPMKNSLVTQLKVVEFTARKEKDIIYINGSLALLDGEREENRWFEAYIMEDKNDSKTRVYMDITRLAVTDEPKMIRTSEEIYENEQKVLTITAYSSSESSEEKIFSDEFIKTTQEPVILTERQEQLSVL